MRSAMLVVISDALSSQVKECYDILGNIKEIFSSDGSATAFSLEKPNRLSRITNTQGTETVCSFDGKGYMNSVAGLDGELTSNEAARRVEMKDADMTTCYQYDEPATSRRRKR